MLAESFCINARSLWLRCLSDDASVSKDFWADIVLYTKANPGKSIFFETLIRQVSFVDGEEDCLKLPLPLLVDNLTKVEFVFDEELWANIINEWSQIKIGLKIKAQTVLLHKEDIIKKFLLAVLGKSKNPRALVRQIVKDSGLLRDYRRNDVIIMLCSIIAESLSCNIEKKKKGDFMQEGIFQMDEEDENMLVKEMLAESVTTADPARCSFTPSDKNNDLPTLWEMFLTELARIPALDERWTDTELYISEVKDITDKKVQEREAIIKRRTLISEFVSKAQYIDDAFRVQLNDMDISVPAADMADSLDNASLEYAIETFLSMQNVLQRYKELSVTKKGNLAEEKKRIGQLFTVMTDIENLVARFSEVTSNPVLAKQEVAKAIPAEQFEAVEHESQSQAEEELPAREQAEEDEAQIELFMGK